MGAYIKEGMDYFPVKVDFFEDYRITNIARRYGAITYKVILKLLCHIWRQGYYLEWNECFAEEFARSISARMNVAKATKIIQSLTTCGYFDAQLYASVSVLSSSAIQEDYFRAVKRRKKKQDSEYKYLLIDIDTVLKSKDDSTPSKTVEVKKEEVKKKEKTDSCQHNVDIMSDRREEKRREENRREEKRKEELSEFATLTHSNACARDKLTQFKAYIKKMMEDKDWQACLKAVYVNEKALFEHLEDNLNLYVNWLLVTAEDGSIVSFADFSRRFYYWIEKHWRKLRPAEKERQDSAEKKESMEERIIRKSLEERKRRDREYQLKINK